MQYTRHGATMLFCITLHTATAYGMEMKRLLVELRQRPPAAKNQTHEIEMVDLTTRALNTAQNADTSDEPASDTPEPTERS